MLNPELFIRPDGLPMAFMMTYKGMQTQTVKQLVEERGGVVFDRPSLAYYRDSMVRLLVGGEVSLRRDQDMFDHRYVLDCVKEDMILPNLLDYRINSHLPSILQQYDPVDVLLGYKRWRDIPEVEGEKVSDIEEDDFDDGSEFQFNSKQNVFKSFRMPYRKEDQLEIVDFLVSNSAFKVVKGNTIWERMEESGLCKGARTWQSMKEHFRKKIIPEIHSFGLSWNQVRRFRAAFGLDQEQESDEKEEETEDEEERIERRKRDKPRPHSEKMVDQFKPRRTSSPIDYPDKIVEETHGDNDVDNEPTTDYFIDSGEEVGEISEEVVVMNRKRKLSSRDASYLNPETEGDESEFNVTPVKKRRIICDFVEIEDDEIIEVIQLDELDTVIISSQDTSEGDKVDPNVAVNIAEDVHGLEDIENLSTTVNGNIYTVSQSLAICSKHIQDERESGNAEATDDNVPCDKTSNSSCAEATKISENPAETLDDIFGDDDDLSPGFYLPHAKRKSASHVSPNTQFHAGSENSILPLPRKETSSGSVNLMDSSTPMLNNRSTPTYTFLQKDVSRSPYLLQEIPGSTSHPKDISTSTSPLNDLSISTSPLKDMYRSTTPLKNGPRYPQKDMSKSASIMKDISNSASLLKYTRSVKVQLRKSVSTSPLKDVSSSNYPLKDLTWPAFPRRDVSRSNSPMKNMSRPTSPMKNMSRLTSPMKNMSRPTVPRKDMSRSTSPMKNISRPTSPMKNMSRSTSPLKELSRSNSPLQDISRSTSLLKYTKSVKVQLRKLILPSPNSLGCPGINAVMGRLVRQEVVAAREDGGGEGGNDGDSDSTDADQVDALDIVVTGHEESTRSEKAKSVKKNIATNFTKTKSAKAERDFWYNSRFKQPYSRGEEEAMVNYFLRNGGYSLRGGNAVWKKMEEEWICPGRTWQSLRERFGKNIEKSLEQFGVNKPQLEEVDRNMEGREGEKARGFRQNANYYSREEDLKILKFIGENKRFDDVRGNEVWQVMEERKVVKGRSWQSMKERFRKVISERIRTYGLSNEIVREFGEFERKKMEKRMA